MNRSTTTRAATRAMRLGLRVNGVPLRTLKAVPSQPTASPEDLGMRWAVAWYGGIQSHSRREGHVAA